MQHGGSPCLLLAPPLHDVDTHACTLAICIASVLHHDLRVAWCWRRSQTSNRTNSMAVGLQYSDSWCRTATRSTMCGDSESFPSEPCCACAKPHWCASVQSMLVSPIHAIHRQGSERTAVSQGSHSGARRCAVNHAPTYAQNKPSIQARQHVLMLRLRIYMHADARQGQAQSVKSCNRDNEGGSGPTVKRSPRGPQ